MRISEGGQGSGNFGHVGRPGRVGGSGSTYTQKDFDNVKKTISTQVLVSGFASKPGKYWFSPEGDLYKLDDSQWTLHLGEVPDSKFDYQMSSGNMSLAEDMGYLRVSYGGDTANIPAVIISTKHLTRQNVLNMIDLISRFPKATHVSYEFSGDKNWQRFTKKEALLELDTLANNLMEGGDGSGNFGHVGRPGQVGGSAKTFDTQGYYHENFFEKRSEDLNQTGAYILTPEGELFKLYRGEEHADARTFSGGDAIIDGGYTEIRVYPDVTTVVSPEELNPMLKVYIAKSPTDSKYTIRKAVRRLGKLDPIDVALKKPVYAVLPLLEGGEGSGNFGHSGRPGKIGGSGPTRILLALEGKVTQVEKIEDGGYVILPDGQLLKLSDDIIHKELRNLLVKKGFTKSEANQLIRVRSYRSSIVYDVYERTPDTWFNIIDSIKKSPKRQNYHVEYVDSFYNITQFSGNQTAVIEQLEQYALSESLREGGRGSGNFGHSGRTGKVGGSSKLSNPYNEDISWVGDSFKNYLKGKELPLAVASKGIFSVLIFSDNTIWYRKDGSGYVLGGRWMDWPEKSWRLTKNQYKKLPLKDRATLQAREELKYYAEREFDDLFQHSVHLAEGGRGSGNFGHGGRIGFRGGAKAGVMGPSGSTVGGGGQGVIMPAHDRVLSAVLYHSVGTLKQMQATQQQGMNYNGMLNQLSSILMSPQPVALPLIVNQLMQVLGVLGRMPSRGLNDPVSRLKLSIQYSIKNLVNTGKAGPDLTKPKFVKDPFKRRAQRMGVNYQ